MDRILPRSLIASPNRVMLCFRLTELRNQGCVIPETGADHPPMNIFATLGTIMNTAYTLFCFALRIWAGIQYVRGAGLGGQFWGAMWTATGMAVVGLLLWLGRAVSGEQLHGVSVLYGLYFI